MNGYENAALGVGRGISGQGQMVTQAQPMQPAVHAALDRQDKAVADLYNVMDELTARLSPILSPVPASNDASKAPSGSSIAGRVETNSEAVARIAGRVRDLLSRLEV